VTQERQQPRTWLSDGEQGTPDVTHAATLFDVDGTAAGWSAIRAGWPNRRPPRPP
jgi:hypothetical protein